ncbi:hypothetical protein [Methylobacterium sp. Leaf100]|uniref:hypothetical protein n=1 Tax=Methylobacterium sp. Leaf100 TaxID=1736252 RepID=UPI0006F28225|nr:hypothetical protein [Methylobacterium sp. Leaf100]KQP32868.1 hypothetical protein ASF25_17820 [Methylobacterium sp. Leaf100]
MMRLDDEATWPGHLLRCLDDGLPLLRGYERERAAWDRRCEEEVMARVGRDPNPHAEGRAAVLAACHDIVLGCRIVGYHCTRLTEGEAVAIERDGLRTLTPELFEGRIERALALGLIERGVAETIIAKNDGRDGSRAGMAWFVFRTRDLADEGGVIRLFSSWGGEALYGRYEDHNTVGPALARIGRPYIVEAAVPAAGIETHCDVGERVMRVYLERREIRTGHGNGMQGYVREDVPSDAILRVIRRDDPEFERLTLLDTWRSRLA